MTVISADFTPPLDLYCVEVRVNDKYRMIYTEANSFAHAEQIFSALGLEGEVERFVEDYD